MRCRENRACSPALKHAQRVEFTGAAKGNDEQEATDQAADDGSGDDSGGDNDRTALLVAAVTTVVLSVANPRLKHTAVILKRSKVKLKLLCTDSDWSLVSGLIGTLQWKFPGWQKKQFFSSDPLGQRFW